LASYARCPYMDSILVGLFGMGGYLVRKVDMAGGVDEVEQILA
jgi:hypothetical protein